MRIGQHLAMAASTTSIAAILLIATAGGLTIEPRPALPATIRSATRHYHDPSLGSMPRALCTRIWAKHGPQKIAANDIK